MINYCTNTCKFKIDKITYSKRSLEQRTATAKISLCCILKDIQRILLKFVFLPLVNIAWNMSEYGFSLSLIFPYKPRFCPYTGTYGSKKTRILDYFTHCKPTYSIYLFRIHTLFEDSQWKVSQKKSASKKFI